MFIAANDSDKRYVQSILFNILLYLFDKKILDFTSEKEIAFNTTQVAKEVQNI